MVNEAMTGHKFGQEKCVEKKIGPKQEHVGLGTENYLQKRKRGQRGGRSKDVVS